MDGAKAQPEQSHGLCLDESGVFPGTKSMDLPEQGCCTIGDQANEAAALIGKAPWGLLGQGCCDRDDVAASDLSRPVAALL